MKRINAVNSRQAHRRRFKMKSNEKYWIDNIESKLELVRNNNQGYKVIGTMFELDLKSFNLKTTKRYQQLNSLLDYYIETYNFKKENIYCYINKKPRGGGMQLSVYNRDNNSISAEFYSIRKGKVEQDC